MEFEKDTQPTDEQRILAETKKMTLQPMNPFLKPEDAPDPVVIAETHANVERDSENTGRSDSLIQPTPSAQAHPSSPAGSGKTGLTVALGIGGTLLVVGLIYLLAY